MYPAQKVSVFAFLLLLSGAAIAQEGAVASISKQAAAVSRVAEPAPVYKGPLLQIRARAETKVLLNWAPVPGAISHYVLERSQDGRHFAEAAVLFTGDWQEEPEYFYTDKFRQPYKGPLYYRLRVVGLEGSVMYTPVASTPQ